MSKDLTEHRVYLDHNVLQPLLKGTQSSFREIFFSSLKDHGLIIDHIPTTVTPFTIYEELGLISIGIDESDKTTVSALLKEESDNRIAMQRIHKYFRQKFENMDRIDIASIQAHSESQVIRCSEAGKKWWIEVDKRHFKRDGFTKDVAEFLATDRMYAYNYPKDRIEGMLDLFFDNWADCLKRKLNISHYRVAQMALEHLPRSSKVLEKVPEHCPGMTAKEFRSEMQKLTRNVGVRVNGDLVDTEIAYFAHVGFFDSNGLNPCLCITKDDLDEGMQRVMLLELAWNVLKTRWDQRNVVIPAIEHGALANVDSSGKVKEIRFIDSAF